MNIQSLGSYGYDEADNLTLLDDDSGFSHFTHDSGNAVVEQSGDMVQRWVVDAAGQTREDAWNYYGWDSAGQLLGVKNKYSGLRTDFERDAQGRLIGSVSATERHAYLWCDEYTPCARVNAHGQIDALYYGQGEVSAAAPHHRYYARDHLGSVRAMVDAQGEVIGRQDYSAYGSVVAQSGLMPSVGYAGMWQHHDSAINLTWYRGYQPAAGRWLSRDPIGEEGGLNLFAYVEGDPINLINSEGLRGNLPGYRPNNARNAAGYHDLRGGFVCEEWNCPLHPFMCTSRDKKRPADFIPPAISANKSDAPDGCECVRLGYRPDWSSPTTEARDIADAYSTYKDSNRMKWHWLRSIKPFPHWYRIGGVGR